MGRKDGHIFWFSKTSSHRFLVNSRHSDCALRQRSWKLTTSKIAPRVMIPARHASQFQIFFVVKDDKINSPGRHDFFWHGVPIYDSRKPFHKESLHIDFNPDMPENSRRSIFVPSSREYTGDGPSLHKGEWVCFEADLLPLFQQGLLNAKAKGALAKSPDSLDAYRITHINIGWEIPGLAKVKGAIRELSLEGELK